MKEGKADEVTSGLRAIMRLRKGFRTGDFERDPLTDLREIEEALPANKPTVLTPATLADRKRRAARATQREGV